ncbi:MAG: hypothetical protein AABY18_00460 [Candidatus Thermoplasmatota archaeon]
MRKVTMDRRWQAVLQGTARFWQWRTMANAAGKTSSTQQTLS